MTFADYSGKQEQFLFVMTDFYLKTYEIHTINDKIYQQSAFPADYIDRKILQ